MNKFLVTLLTMGLLLSFNFVGVSAADNCEDYCGNVENETMPSGTVCYCSPLMGDGLGSIIDPIIGFIFKISMVLVPLLVIYGAFMIVTAAGDSAKIEQAKKIIFWTLVGFVIVLLSRGVGDLIEVIIGI